MNKRRRFLAKRIRARRDPVAREQRWYRAQSGDATIVLAPCGRPPGVFRVAAGESSFALTLACIADLVELTPDAQVDGPAR